jgi:DNA polymerase-3 subunit delta
MLLKGEQLAAHLERELRPLYVLYGDEPLLVLEAADFNPRQSSAKGLQRARSADRTAAF